MSNSDKIGGIEILTLETLLSIVKKLLLNVKSIRDGVLKTYEGTIWTSPLRTLGLNVFL